MKVCPLAIRAPSLCRNISGLTLILQVSMMLLVRERRGKARKKDGMMKSAKMNGTWLAVKNR